jgi:hypothetical protein
MPTQEEKVTVLEENITILLGIASGKEKESYGGPFCQDKKSA